MNSLRFIRAVSSIYPPPYTFLAAGRDLSFDTWHRRATKQMAQRDSGDVQIDRSVWKAHENMPLKNVYLLFANLRCIRLFIIAGDRLTGIISRSILYKVCIMALQIWRLVVKTIFIDQS